MTWNDVLDRLRAGGLNPVEETYMENYGKVLAAQRPEFQGRQFRCACGVVRLENLRVEVLLFPSELHRDEFFDIVGSSAQRMVIDNTVLEFSESDPAKIHRVVDAMKKSPA